MAPTHGERIATLETDNENTKVNIREIKNSIKGVVEVQGKIFDRVNDLNGKVITAIERKHECNNSELIGTHELRLSGLETNGATKRGERGAIDKIFKVTMVILMFIVVYMSYRAAEKANQINALGSKGTEADQKP